MQNCSISAVEHVVLGGALDIAEGRRRISWGVVIAHITLRDLLTQKCMHKKKVADFGYPRACRFRKNQILNRSPELGLPTFFKT
jgi:hypothetical protein